MPKSTLVSSAEGPLDAPVVVLGNPIGTTRDAWAHQLPVLSRYFRIIRYEARGHGQPGQQSPVRPGSATIADLGADVLAMLDERGIDRFAFAGVSLGGMTGIWLAALAPQRVTALAVCCAALTPLPDARAWHDRAALVRAAGMAPLADLVIPRWFTPQFMAREPEQVQAVAAMLKGTAPEGYASCAEAIAALDLRPQLPSVQAPTLVLSGAEDIAAPPAVGAYTARHIPGARLTVVQAAAHFAHYEKPGPVTDALLTHFQASLGALPGYAASVVGLPTPTATSQIIGVVLATEAGSMPRARRMDSTLRAIQASPAASGCRMSLPPARAYRHRLASGFMMMARGSADRAAATIARLIACTAGGGFHRGPAKTVSSAIRARGARARISFMSARTRRSSPAGRTPESSRPAWMMTRSGERPGSCSSSSMRAIGPRPLSPSLA